MKVQTNEDRFKEINEYYAHSLKRDRGTVFVLVSDLKWFFERANENALLQKSLDEVNGWLDEIQPLLENGSISTAHLIGEIKLLKSVIEDNL